jgi:hypothetical protein
MYHFRSISAGKVRRVGYNLADHVGGGGVTNIGGGAQLPMSTVNEDHVIVSELPDISHLQLDAEINFDVKAEYERLMSRTGINDGEPDTTEVSAFNSSI